MKNKYDIGYAAVLALAYNVSLWTFWPTSQSCFIDSGKKWWKIPYKQILCVIVCDKVRLRGISNGNSMMFDIYVKVLALLFS